MIKSFTSPAAIVCLSVLLAAGCATVQEEAPAAEAPSAQVPPAAMVAAIREAAGDGASELAVQPLRDPRVEDLRETAAALEAAGDTAGAAQALDQALEIVDNDPALLQERAEVALLQEEFAMAGELAERAYALGAQVGPLCRRHWATLEQLRLREGDEDGAASAREQVTGCRVAGPERY